jgi:RimJ/RimL family protein N-acetyltransferase
VRHSLTIDGPAFRLRPVRIADAAFIAELRADPERARYLHRGPAGEVSQRRWLESYFERRDDFYFLIENQATGAPEGTVGIYNAGWSIEGRTGRLQRDAEWGRWILRRGSLAALESACLVYRAGFEMLDFDSTIAGPFARMPRLWRFTNPSGWSEGGCCLATCMDWTQSSAGSRGRDGRRCATASKPKPCAQPHGAADRYRPRSRPGTGSWE